MLVSRVMALSSSWNHVNVTVPPVPSINVDIQFARRHPVTRISHHRFAKVVVIAKMIIFPLEEIIIIMLKAKIIQFQFPKVLVKKVEILKLSSFGNILNMNLDFPLFLWLLSLNPLWLFNLDFSKIVNISDEMSYEKVFSPFLVLFWFLFVNQSWHLISLEDVSS